MDKVVIIMPDSSKYGVCDECGGALRPVHFTDEEYIVDAYGHLIRTGRKRNAVSHLVCERCLTNVCVDDSFDGPWHY